MTIPIMRQPALFVSHGAPTLLLDSSPAHHFLKSLGKDIVRTAKPRAILIMSAHFERPNPTLSAHPRPETLYDFHGFPAPLYQQIYPAPGSADIAHKIQALLQTQDYEVDLDKRRGFDHGTWIPLSLMFPAADIPVVQLSINPVGSPEYHYLLGRNLAELRAQNILVIGSGNLTHNLREFFGGDYILDTPAPAWVSEFADWMVGKIEAGHTDDILNLITRASHGRRNHPTLDHIHPLFFALGAGMDVGEEAVGQRLHVSISYGVLAMDVYAFGN